MWMNNYGQSPYMYQPQYQRTLPTAQQPQQQQTQQPAYSLQPTILQYATEEEVSAYIVPVGGQVLAFDPNKNVMYIKSLDQLGRPVFKRYKFDEITASTAVEEPKPDYVRKEDLSEYATKADIKRLAECIAKLNGGTNGQSKQT